MMSVVSLPTARLRPCLGKFHYVFGGGFGSARSELAGGPRYSLDGVGRGYATTTLVGFAQVLGLFIAVPLSCLVVVYIIWA